MLGLGPWELGAILAVVLIIFGAGKLPNVMRDLGKGVSEFKKAQADDGTVAAPASGAAVAVPVAPSSPAPAPVPVPVSARTQDAAPRA